ncbi:MAG: hypothetical protein V3V78_02025 [Candidatus Woesearchaeota archaeon]
MAKKEVLILLTLLFLLVINVNAQTNISDEDLPASVQVAIAQLIEDKEEEKEVQRCRILIDEYKKEKKTDLVPKLILGVAGIILLFLFFVYPYLHKKNTWGEVRRRSRRQLLYSIIARKLKKGKTYPQITDDLLDKGYKKKHVYDAIYRYKGHHRKIKK